ncbi:MAG TPA: beta-N-acetylglucosaminidase domain-containing protein [Cellvibrio sp.]|nr:beta-N-acetylglucosaminidase domain-containing protein [Cellvibrio sp.]
MQHSAASTHKNQSTPLGVIEGFFGREWDMSHRAAYAKFFAQYGFNFYIYAPKSDKHLRKLWQQDWSTEKKASLLKLREIYFDARVKFGIGLSPHEIYLDPSRNQRDVLTRRIHQINTLSPDILCILFDDMRGDIPGLAQIQIDIAHQAAEISTASKIIFCPTYYSFDPVLEKVFGTRPTQYWDTFSNNLDHAIDMFWTGEKVCSPDYSSAHIEEVTNLLGRKPFLWDNYPVNDGAIKSNFLQLRAVDKNHAQLRDKLSGHALNPMNQSWLSQIPLASLPIAYESQQHYEPQNVFTMLCQKICGEEVANELIKDIEKFQDRGLKNLTADEKIALHKKYENFPNNPFAQEIVSWLNGQYQFDPACLTE